MSNTIKMIVVGLLSQTSTIIADPKAMIAVKTTTINVILMATKTEEINTTDKVATEIIDNTMIIDALGVEDNSRTTETDRTGTTKGTKKAGWTIAVNSGTINETGRITIITRAETDRLAKMNLEESLSKRSLTKNRSTQIQTTDYTIVMILSSSSKLLVKKMHRSNSRSISSRVIRPGKTTRRGICKKAWMKTVTLSKWTSELRR